MEHLYRNNILCKAQHGFLIKQSTNTNLLSCWNDWTLARDKKSSTDIIYTDLERAFDKVVHSKLLYKIESIGIIGTWKLLTVQDAENKSRQHLSPVAFLRVNCLDHCYLPGALSPNSTISLYADDSKIYKDCVTLFDCLPLYSHCRISS